MNPNDKTTSAEQDPMAQPDHVQNANQSHQKSRRRLLKAATVAPVIYTLPIGNALANSSTCENIEGNVINVEENGSSGNLKDSDGNVYQPDNKTDSSPYSGESYHHNSDSQEYRYRDDPTWGEQLLKGSCWTSIHTTVSGSMKNFETIA